MTQGAVQVQRADARRVLRHRCAGDRLLRAVQPVLRPRARRVPRALGLLHREAERGLRHAGERRRVLRARPLRRRARDLRPRLAHRKDERHVRVRRLQDPRRHAARHRAPDARPRRPRRAQGDARARRLPRRPSLASRATMSSTSGALEAIDRILDARRRRGRHPPPGRRRAPRRRRLRLGRHLLRRGRRARPRPARRHARRDAAHDASP